MEWIFRGADGAEVSAKVEQDRFHGTGSGIEAEQ
jgi:hypothetical protein